MLERFRCRSPINFKDVLSLLGRQLTQAEVVDEQEVRVQMDAEAAVLGVNNLAVRGLMWVIRLAVYRK